MKNDLFNQTLMRKYSKNFKLTPSKHDLIVKHVTKLEESQFKAETKNYIYFYEVWLKGILGYDLDENVLFDEKEDQGRGKSEFILKSGDKKFMVVELKDQKTDLDKPQNRANDKRTPVDQAFDYAQHNGDIDWILVSNYDEFRLYNWHKKGQYISFNVAELLDKTLFSYFMLSFSKKSYIETGLIDRLMDKTVVIERELEKEFYKLYNETRLMLITEFEELNNLSRVKAIHYAQMIMNRYMFICFAEDIDLLPAQVSTDTILTPILKGNLRHGSIWQRLNELFLDINEGNEYKKISQYNGGIFKENLDHLKIRDIVEDQKFFNDVYQNWKFEEYEKDINTNLGPYGKKVNPIYRNMLTISTFDFSTELDVNILGHIFENSIGDIEELKAGSKGRRKKEGIFYTPDYITDYICRNTIIPYLSKNGKAETVSELILEYATIQDIETLETKVMNIKIVDPACGSGAFLNKASDILLDIHKSIYDFKKGRNTTIIETKGGKGKDKVKRTATHVKLDSFFDEVSARRKILIHNIYGVDLNEESVDITKLALFLKVCQENRKLPDLEKNIKCGNSLIDDPEYTDKPFNWKKKFPEIFKEGGFDVIIGNPPWGVDFSENELKYLRKTNKDIIVRMIDSFMYFVYRFSLKMNGNGFFGMIVPDVILYQPNNLKLRKYLINNYSISRIINVGNNVFGDVTRPSSIVIFNALKNETKCIKSADFSKLSSDEIKMYIQDESSFESYDQELINDTPGNLFLTSYIDRYKILRKIKVNTSYTLADMVDSDKINRGVSPDLKESFIIKEDIIDEYNLEKSKLKKVLTGGKQVKRYYIDYQGHYLIYTTNKDHFEKIPNICNYIQQFKDRIKCKEVIQNKHSIYALHRPRKERIFTKKNKIVGVITSDKIIVTLDNDQYFTTDGLYLFSPIDKIDPLYLIGILNSKLFVFLYRLYSLEFGRVLAQVKPTIISQLPMYNVTLEEQQSIIEKASIMLQLNEQLQKEAEGFQYWLKHTFRFDNLSQKLKYYYELQLDEFFDELRKKKVDIMLRKNQELLRNEYEKSLSIIKPLLLEIKQTDNAINRMVYDLYGLTQEEIKIIEKSLI